MYHAHDRLLGFLKTEYVISMDIYIRVNPRLILQVFLFVYVKCLASLLLAELFFSCSYCLGKRLSGRDDHREKGTSLHHHIAHTKSGDNSSLCVCTWVDGTWGVQPVVLPLCLQGPKVA